MPLEGGGGRDGRLPWKRAPLAAVCDHVVETSFSSLSVPVCMHVRVHVCMHVWETSLPSSSVPVGLGLRLG